MLINKKITFLILLYVLSCTLYHNAQSQVSNNVLAGVNEKVVHSLKKMFGDSVSVTLTKIILSTDEKKQIFDNAKTSWNKDTITTYVCKSTSKSIIGYGFTDDVKGKVQFITYLVGVKLSGEIVDVDILSYREAYGGEIMYESFRKQFINKTASDQLTPGKDIKNISGATISVRAITLGVKRILTTFELLHKRIQ